ncbi:uncharacterized protein FN964_011697 [Alca torda]
MAVHTPLPPNLRRGLVAFSGSLFINNKTWDSGAARSYPPAHEVLASLPLQMMLYFNVYYFPVWFLAEGMMLQLKVPSCGAYGVGGVTPLLPDLPWACMGRGEGSLFQMNGSTHTHKQNAPSHTRQRWLASGSPQWKLAGWEEAVLPLQYQLLPQHYQFLLVAAFLILSLAEGSRLYLGYVGNLQEKCDYAARSFAQDPSAHPCPFLLEWSWEGIAGEGGTRRQGDKGDPLTLLLYPSLCYGWDGPVPGVTASDHVQAQLHVEGMSPALRPAEWPMQGAPGAESVPPPTHGFPQVPELAGFLLLSVLIQLPLLLFLLTDSHVIRLPLEMAVHSLFLAFLLAEITAAFLALKTMTKQLAAQFYLQQLKEGSRGQGGTGS